MTGQPHHIEGLEIDHLLARGGSASVYEAFDRRHARKVAVKILDSRDFEAPKRRAFRRELEAMGRLDDHPYVLSVFDSGFTEDGSPYLVMPLVATGTVAQRIAREESFGIDELLSVAVKLGSALETAHQRGILHCDIKPSNLFIGPFGDPMLGDLGISSVAESGVTATNRVSLTLRYAAPEIIEGAEHTVLSDIYSLGATFFTMTDLAPPFHERSKAALVTRIVSGPERPVLVRDVPSEFAALVSDMMAVDPKDRPQSALAVVQRLQAIERLQGNEPTSAAIVRADDATQESQSAPHPELASDSSDGPNGINSKRNRRLAVAAIAALLVAVAGIGFWQRSGSDATAAVSTARAIAESPTEAAAPPVPTVAPTQAATQSVPATAVPPSATDVAPTTVPTVAVTSLPTVAPTVASTAAPDAVATAEPVDEVAGLVEEAPADPPTIAGVVLSAAGTPLEAVKVELFRATDDQRRGDFVEGLVTDQTGRYGFVAPGACYVLTFVAPEGFIVQGGSLHREVPVCLDSALSPVAVDATIVDAPTAEAFISGTIWLQGQATPVGGVHVDAFVAEGEQARGAFVAGVDTTPDGLYTFDVPAGCYILTVSAPEGQVLVGGDRFLNSPTLCVDAQVSATFDAELQ